MKEIILGLGLITMLIIVVGMMTQCELESKALHSKQCYEQTKDVKCWNLK